MKDNLRDKFLFEVLKAVTDQSLALDEFKSSILSIIDANMRVSGLRFYDYSIKLNNSEKCVMSNSTTLNMKESCCNDRWLNYYYRTYIYNPNHRCVNEKLKGEKKSYCILSITDLISYDEYENSRNYQEIVKPSGYYYSLAIYFRNGDKLISSIAMARSKEEGDFTDEEIAMLDSVCPFINDRMVRYDRERQQPAIKKLMVDVLGVSPVPMLLLDERLNLIAGNQPAEDMCATIFGVGECPMKKAADVVAHHSKFNENRITVNSSRRPYYLQVNPYYTSDNANAVAYLVSISREAFEAAQTAGCAEKIDLTERQRQIIELIAAGKTNKEIADEMYISENTVRKHVENIRVKLGVKNRIAILKELSILSA